MSFCSFKNKQKALTIPWHIYSMSAVKGQGPPISLGDYEHESWLLPRKQKEDITKRTYQLFSSLPTNTYMWQLEMLVTLALLGPITNLLSHTFVQLIIFTETSQSQNIMTLWVLKRTVFSCFVVDYNVEEFLKKDHSSCFNRLLGDPTSTVIRTAVTSFLHQLSQTEKGRLGLTKCRDIKWWGLLLLLWLFQRRISARENWPAPKT